MPIILLGQPGGRHNPSEFRFKFFGKNGEIITPNNKQYKIKINFAYPSSKSKDSINFDNGYFSCISFFGAIIRINFISETDTMEIHTYTSHDSIPFLKGHYSISSNYAPIFSIIPHSITRIKERNWENFKVRDFKETILPHALIKTDSQFWKDYNKRIPLAFTPSIYGLLYNPHFSSKIYAWDWNNLYVSIDKGKNWENILTVNEPYETPIVSFKDKNTLILFKTKKYQKLINKIPEVYFSKDGGQNWQMDTTYTKMGIYFAGFNNKKEGFAYAIKYFKEERETKTVFYVSKDGGRKWIEVSSSTEKLFPLSVDFWNEKSIIVNGLSGTYRSSDGGENWNSGSKTFEYHQSFDNSYPSFTGNDFMHSLERIDNANMTISKLLTIKNDWYVYMIATKNIWCVSGQGYTIISKDQGKNWDYYYGSASGTSVFTIIDDKYIFDGTSLFSIK